MDRRLLITVSPYKQKYYINEHLGDLPEQIKEVLRAKVGVLATTTEAIISLGFTESANIFIDYEFEDKTMSDDIGAELKIRKFEKEETELLKSLKTWYTIYHTPNGQILVKIATLRNEGKSDDDIYKECIKEFGEEDSEFVGMMLED